MNLKKISPHEIEIWEGARCCAARFYAPDEGTVEGNARLFMAADQMTQLLSYAVSMLTAYDREVDETEGDFCNRVRKLLNEVAVPGVQRTKGNQCSS